MKLRDMHSIFIYIYFNDFFALNYIYYNPFKTSPKMKCTLNKQTIILKYLI